jgi:uncharacterized damage-inducible protein DinB
MTDASIAKEHCVESATRRTLIAEFPEGYPPEIARWLWVFADTRRRTLEVLDGFDEARIDEPGPAGNSVGTILAHIAVIETDWLCVEILGEDYPADLLAHLPPDVRDADGHLLATPGLPLARYLAALAAVRAKLVERVGALAPADLQRVRSLPAYDVTPEWVLNHLVQHEAEHRAEISVIRAVFEGRPLR